MISKTSLLLVGSLAFGFTILGFGDQQASAFEPTPKELKVMETVGRLSLDLEKIDRDDPGYYRAISDYYNARIALNKMGIYTEDQDPDLRYLMNSIHNGTREYAQAMNGTDIQDRPPKVTNPCATCPPNDKTIYVASGYRDPYVLWKEFNLTTWYIGDVSPYIKTGEKTFAIFEPKWTGVNSDITPYCKVGSATLPAKATYNVSMSMKYLIDDFVLIPHVTKSGNVNFVWYHPHENTEFPRQKNVDPGPTITCTLHNVSVK